MAQGSMDDAISFREPHQSGQLTSVGLGIQVEPQPNCFETNRCFLVYAERASRIDITYCFLSGICAARNS